MTLMRVCATANAAFFPAVLFAAALGFHSQAFFDLGEERATVSATPQVKF